MKLGRFLSLTVLVLCLLLPVMAWAEQAVVADATQAVETAAKAGGNSMPQLDPTFFISQLFWLAVTGIFLYVMMSVFALPRVAQMVAKRDDQVREDLEASYLLKQQAEDLKIAYNRTLRDADERSHALMETTARELKEKHYAALAQGNIKIQLKITETESYLRGEKNALINESAIIADRVAKAVLVKLQQEAA